MKKKILIGSIIAVAIIILSSFSSVVGKASIDNELVELDVELCGLGRKYTVKLTQEECKEVEFIFDDVQDKLNDVKSDDETISIFNDAIFNLYEYGLIDISSINELQNLIGDRYFNLKTKFIFEKLFNNNLPTSGYNNFLCLISGQVSGITLGFLYSLLDWFISNFNWYMFPFNGMICAIILLVFLYMGGFTPFSILSTIQLDTANFVSFGLFGLDIVRNSGKGEIYGYTGIKITIPVTLTNHLLGFALYYNID